MTILPTCHFHASAFVAASFMFGLPVLANQAPVPADVVGEVTTVIGRGKVVNPQGEQPAVRGHLIRAGDQVATDAGGHVHVRFVDGGIVSVRPLSRLHIENYRNSNSQQLAAIKFRLDVGVIRSVTGEWGEAHRDRFRLNTPVAAIGIKGTDFVAKADSSSTLVSVKTGAIEMSPLEGACALALGPCAGERSTLLSADMPGKVLEYFKQNDRSVPRLIPYVDLLARNHNSVPVAEQSRVEAIVSDNVAGKAVDNHAKETVAAVSLPVNLPIGSPASEPASLPLAWLHNALEWNVPAHTISTRFDEASAAGRNPLIGNFFISLYRDESIKKDFAPPSVTASFNLQSASANYVQLIGPPEVVNISNAKLTVDFARSALTTQMDLASASMGKNSFAATATIAPNGVFVSNTANQQLAGAFSTDAAQAGYLFEKRLVNGTVSGLTLWGR